MAAFDDLFADGWLPRRRAFCEARIKARGKADLGGRSGLIIAGLHRELAAIALIQSDLPSMQNHLLAAGRLLRGQGVAHGLVLLGLAGEHAVLEDPLARGVIQVASSLDRPGTDDLPRGGGDDSHSPHQWLAVLQAGLLAGSAEDPGPFAVLIDRLRPLASVTLANGLPLGLYLDLLAPRDAAFAKADTVRADLFAVFSWRRRLLRIAQDDLYHWQGSLDAAKLIDFDLLTLFVRRPIAGVSEGLWFDGSVEDTTLDLLPMILADRMRGFGPRGPVFVD